MTRLKGSIIEKYIINELDNLTYIGDLWLEDDSYIFNAKAIESESVNFDNSIFEVVEVDYSDGYGCFIKLKTQASLIDLAVSKCTTTKKL